MPQHVIMRPRVLRYNLAGAMARVQHDHGDLVMLHVNRQRILMIADPERIREHFFDHPQLVRARKDTIETGMLAKPSPDSLPNHAELRRLIAAAGVGRGSVASVIEGVDAAVEREDPVWASARPVSIIDCARRIAVGVCGSALLGVRLTPAQADGVAAAMATIERVQVITSPLIRLDDRLRLRAPRRFVAKYRLLGLAEELVAAEPIEEEEEAEETEEKVPSLARRRLAAALGRPLSRVEQADFVVNILMAGVLALTGYLSWLLVAFAREEEAVRAVKQEWLSVLGNGAVTAEALPELKLTRAFAKETARRYTPTLYLTRRVAADVEFAGFQLRRGDQTLIPVRQVHLDARYWPEPRRFSLARWTDGASSASRFTYLTFGLGAHRCVGEVLAIEAAVALLPALFRRWRLEVPQTVPVVQSPLYVPQRRVRAVATPARSSMRFG